MRFNCWAVSSLATLIYQYEISGAKMGGGYLGTNPFQAFGYLDNMT